MSVRETDSGFNVAYLFADRASSQIYECIVPIEKDNPIIPSITDRVHAAAGYEREINDMYGIFPQGHPNPKRLAAHENWPEKTYPMQRSFPKDFKPPFADVTMPYQTVTGQGVYQIPVGPVHAGIIEPGHFRFSVAGNPSSISKRNCTTPTKASKSCARGKVLNAAFILPNAFPAMKRLQMHWHIARQWKRPPDVSFAACGIYAGHFRGNRKTYRPFG
jgi:hypothetical protein